MKKFLILTLSIILMVSMSSIAFADVTSTSNSSSSSSANSSSSAVINNGNNSNGIGNGVLTIITGTAPPADVSNATQPTASALQCAVFLPGEMTMRDAARCAGKEYNGQMKTVKIFYTNKEDLSEVMSGYSMTNYVSAKRFSVTGKNAIYLPPVCEAVYDLGLAGADVVVVNKVAGQYDGKKKGSNFGINFIIFFQQESAVNSLEERWDVVALGFRSTVTTASNTALSPPK